MTHDLTALLGPTGVLPRAALEARTSRTSVRTWISTGRLLVPHPGVLVLPDRAGEDDTRAWAALGWTGGALSHVSALSALGITGYRQAWLHVTVPPARRLRSRRLLTVHRADVATVSSAAGFATTTPVRALVDSWELAHRPRHLGALRSVVREALLRATREGQVRIEELRAELVGRPQLAGRPALIELLDLIAGGCQSWLEMFAVRHVLDVPGLPPCRQQYRLRTPVGWVGLDAAWPEARLAVELDGAAFHGDPADRERDVRRDAALATMGWLTLRFSYRRLTGDPQACRSDIAGTYAARVG